MIHQRRSAYTLVEMLAVMTAMAVLLTSIGTTLHVMVRASANLREANTAMTSVDRLSTRFQSDAHRATSATVVNNVLTLEGNAATVVYTSVGKQVERSVATGETQPRREIYPLPRGYTAHWSVNEATRSIVQMRLEFMGESSDRRLPRISATETLAAIGLEHAQ